MPLVGTRGAASAQGFGEFAKQTAANYIEDVFSTYLYTGNGSTQTITNGIDLSATGGGLVIDKLRIGNTQGARFYDTVRGADKYLDSTVTSGQTTDSNSLYNFSTTGFTVGSGGTNANTYQWVGWTFKKQPKFFDIVTYTGNGANRTIAHNLGSVPGCIIVKRTDTTGAWQVYHRSLANTEYLVLNTTAAKATGTTRWNSTTPTSTEFSLGTDATVNANGGTYVAYLFAHDAGGFGTAGTDNVISCGSVTDDGSGNGVFANLGWEPQWVLVKRVDGGAENWAIADSMRGIAAVSVGDNSSALFPNVSSTAETTSAIPGRISARGWTSPTGRAAGQTFIYIAIRRGPMKTPTSGTSVFDPLVATSPTGTVRTTNFPVDLQINQTRTGNSAFWMDRLRGMNSPNYSAFTPYFQSNGTLAEATSTDVTYQWNNTGYSVPPSWNNANTNFLSFRRAPSFMDVVCYTGTGATLSVSHNLGVVPELIIFKRRDSPAAWPVWRTATGTGTTFGFLNDPGAEANQGTQILTATPTSTAMSVAAWGAVNGSAGTYVAYLFASCPGVSKVGSYSGTGGTQTISCGFAARFVMIKRTDSTGDWWHWDTSGGMVAGTDPRLAFNTGNAFVNANWVYTDASGFQIVTTDASVNASGGSYIFLAVA